MNLRHPGWWWRKLGPIVILILTLLKFLPFIRYSHASILKFAYTNPSYSLHEEALHFWTVFGANVLEYLLLNLVYWWTLIDSKDHRKWTSGPAGSSMLCSVVVAAVLVSLVTGWKLPWIRLLLIEVMEKVISRPKESTNDRHRFCYCSSRYNFRYVAFISRTLSSLRLPPQVMKEYGTKHQASRCISSIMLLAVEKYLHQHKGNHGAATQITL